MSGKYEFAIDRGGTFTDVWCCGPEGDVRVMKLLSVDPANYPDAPTEGIRRILEQLSGTPHSSPVDSSNINWIRMGTTVATNALLERSGTRMALAITAGFRDLLHIGNQARPDIFDLKIEVPGVLYEEVVEIDERLVLQQDTCEIQRECHKITGTTSETLEVWQNIDDAKVRADLTRVYNKGIRSLAVVLMHSYTCGDHERTVRDIALSLGFTNVSLSCEVMPMVRIVPRGFTACADAYLTPCIKQYISSFRSGFSDNLKDVHVSFMQSDGGLTPIDKFSGSRAILSGPAGGVVGYALTTYNTQTQKPVIGFDMGGTSTDVSRFDGHYDHVFESTTAGVTMQVPQLDINTVAAGGGSQLFFRAGMFVVGPDSAGAHPGPVCYRKGGPLTVTDANLCLGRIIPRYFPHIFGPTEDEPLDLSATLQAMHDLTHQINAFNRQDADINESDVFTVEDVAMGYIRVANETMCRPIRALTQARGHDTSAHVLACFGGAGGQHACSIARSLGMSHVFIHRFAGILSAYGMALADIVHETQEPSATLYSPENFSFLDERIIALSSECEKELLSQKFSRDKITLESYLHLRYDRTDCALMISVPDYLNQAPVERCAEFLPAFIKQYEREFGFHIPDRDVIVDDIRVRGVGRSFIDTKREIEIAEGPPVVQEVHQCYFDDGYHPTNVYLLTTLRAGHLISGPAIIIDNHSTIVVEPTCTAEITRHGDIDIKIGSGVQPRVGTDLNAIQLSIFSHRFMSTAEQMGRVLQRTAISVNIKERLDFSCAVFGPNGGLVANAPHIPIHLGAMQETVKYQIRSLGDQMSPGDVFLSNHPQAGGSHLPDLTVITPVFYGDIQRPVFFVASRGHHADIGGATPGSMPPFSKTIHEEGAVFLSFRLVVGGVFQEQAVTEALMAPAQFPGCSGTRGLNDNLSDLRAQVAANQKGITLIHGLIDEYGLDVVQAYMEHIQHNAEVSVREMLKHVVTRTGQSCFMAEDSMDIGAEIRLRVDVDPDSGSAVFDFIGTSPEVYSNINAPRAVTLSAIIYCLRCLVGHDIPLNQGCLMPITVIIPKGCFLDPSENAAVIGGNVETSQRLVDVIFRLFSACAASQGTMNNMTFGDETVGSYETVAGGAGAGPGWHGRSGVHTHMTNTRITDPEILERRYPVILRRFCLNPGTGGRGQYNGGDGVIREVLFRKRLTVCLLGERRVFPPYGVNGGEPGKKGVNLMFFKDGRVVSLGGRMLVDVVAGDCLHIETPGGGGWGDSSMTTSSQGGH